MPTKIFVGNLSSDTKSDDLKELFESYGTVVECDVLRNFGFVHMEDEYEAQVAIRELDGHTIHGQRIRVEVSTKKKGSQSAPTKIFVGNLSYDTKSDDLRELFERYGGVAECDVLKSYGFVHMEDEFEAQAAIRELDGHSLHGQRIRVEISTGKKVTPTMPTKIFVGNLSSETKSDDIRRLFEGYGTVVECDVLKNYGFVHMENEGEAQAAITDLDGHLIHGQKMRVEVSTGNRGNEAGPDKRGFPPPPWNTAYHPSDEFHAGLADFGYLPQGPGSRTMPTKIFVGNLSSETKSDDIRDLFEKHGTVLECDVLKNYGFVHMQDENEAQSAITELDGYFIHGQRMRVEMSTGKKGNGGGKEKRGPAKGRGPPMPPPPRRASYDRYPPPPSPYDRYDPYARYPYPERDYYRPLPVDRYPPRMPPPPPPGERYPPPIPRDRLPPPERPLPPADRRGPYADPRDRMVPPPRERLPLPYADERSPYERARPLERAPPHDPYYRERSPLARPPPEYYDRQKAEAGRTSMNGQGYPNGYDYYRPERPEYRAAADYYDRTRAYDSRPQPAPTSSYYPPPHSSGTASSNTTLNKQQYDRQTMLQTGPIFF